MSVTFRTLVRSFWSGLVTALLYRRNITQRLFRTLSATKAGDRDGQLLFAAKIGAARELFEETGIDVRAHLDRLVPAHLRSFDPSHQGLVNQLGHRLFFILTLINGDFTTDGVQAMCTDDDVVNCAFAHVRVSV
jgi:8-oxo-dGTP pyrophosphatase MutT (NUDIX family)